MIEKINVKKYKKKKGPRNIYIIIGIILIFLINGFIRKVPKGTSYQGLERKESNIEFLYDLNYRKDGQAIKEMEIFKEKLKIIEGAEDFIIIDMFLFNDDYDRSTDVSYPDLSEQLTNKLIDKKKEIPDIEILFITDEINNFYGVYESPYIKN